MVTNTEDDDRKASKFNMLLPGLLSYSIMMFLCCLYFVIKNTVDGNRNVYICPRPEIRTRNVYTVQLYH
jgi:hypothetical protein